MTSIGMICNIEQASRESSSISQSATVDAENKRSRDNDDRNVEKSDLFHALHRSEADGMSLSQTFDESGETSSDGARYIQDAPQEATINNEPSNPTVAPKQNREENASIQHVFEKDSAKDNKIGKQKPCAVVTPVPRQSVTSYMEETVMKTSSTGDGEDMANVSHPNMTHVIASQPDGLLFEASEQESEQIKDIAEEIDLAQNSTEPCLPHRSCPLSSVDLTQIGGDKCIDLNMKGKVNDEFDNNTLDGEFPEFNCNVLMSHNITKTQMVPQGGELNGIESAQNDNISKHFEGEEESSKIHQDKKLCVIQVKTSNNILDGDDIKCQKVLSECEPFNEGHHIKNRNGRMKRKRYRNHKVGLRSPLHKVRFPAIISEKRCKGHTRKRKIQDKYGHRKNLSPKGDSCSVKLEIRGLSGLKNMKNGNLLSNKENLRRTYQQRKRDQLIKTIGNYISSKPEIWMKARHRSDWLKKTPLKKSGSKRNFQSKNSLTTRHKGSKENKAAYAGFQNKDNIPSKAGHTKKATSVIDNLTKTPINKFKNDLFIHLKKNVYVFFYFRNKHGSKKTMTWHNLYSSILKCVILDLGSVPFVQLTVAPGRELIYCKDFEDESRRRQTFRTYENQDIVESLVRNGFFYSERDNQIVCYKCGGRQGRLRDGDIPERAHRSDCRFWNETDPGVHTIIPERARNSGTRDDVRVQIFSNPTRASPGWYMVNGGPEQFPNSPRVALSGRTLERSRGEGRSVPGSVLHHRLQVFIAYFRRQNDPREERGGRPMTVIPPFPFDEVHEPRRHITVLPPRAHMNGGRRRSGIIALPPRPQPHESIFPVDGAINHTRCTEAISTPNMSILLLHRCVFCRRRQVSIRFKPCEHAIACYQCSVSKFICTECSKIIMQKIPI